MEILASYNLQELRVKFQELGFEPYRANQVLGWVYRKFKDNFQEMTDIPKEQRTLLSQAFRVHTLKPVERIETKDSVKYIFRTEDGSIIETVLIFERDHLTLCLSSQVGCAVGCKFCATAKDGLFRNLTTAEIVDQYLWVQKDAPSRIRNVVFMGMGEPLANYEAVRKAVEIMVNPWGIGLSKRRVSISTSGLISQLKRMAQDPLLRELNLAVSVNAPYQYLRELLMPISKTNNLKELMQTLADHPYPPDRRIMLEYVLIKDINDSEAHARAFAQLIVPYRNKFKVNLIPYNPDPSIAFERPSMERVYAFQEVLRSHHISTFIRLSKGVDVFGACGQLRSKRLELVVK
ncbi:MAG: 23S rRNA (adenine(2503)-C(2))-methyltransferase RlmN [Aquificaceae bacterium]|nr:23S rRNA (adenine(2503)-C(2))-methyltransferase RlmN [Aquificaceae bacterium]MCX8163946.1 23S rRNA (adenine(2503)-C(2))-methyltransferase RlmN [Aquificaceae bacterium]